MTTATQTAPRRYPRDAMIHLEIVYRPTGRAEYKASILPPRKGETECETVWAFIADAGIRGITPDHSVRWEVRP